MALTPDPLVGGGGDPGGAAPVSDLPVHPTDDLVDRCQQGVGGVGVFRDLQRIGYAIQFTVPAAKSIREADKIWAAILASVRRVESDE